MGPPYDQNDRYCLMVAMISSRCSSSMMMRLRSSWSILTISLSASLICSWAERAVANLESWLIRPRSPARSPMRLAVEALRLTAGMVIPFVGGHYSPQLSCDVLLARTLVCVAFEFSLRRAPIEFVMHLLGMGA